MLIENIKVKTKSKKLNNIKVELVSIKVRKRNINYKLKLLKDIKVHFIFYILLLELINSKIAIQNTFHYLI